MEKGVDLSLPRMPEETTRILIVDDEPNVLTVLVTLLSTNYECTGASSALQALAFLSRTDYDLVLSDITMPGMNGLELIEAIRAGDKDAVVVVISGNLSIEGAIEAMRRGAYD